MNNKNNNKKISDYLKTEYMIIDNYTEDEILQIKLKNRIKQIKRINKYNAIMSLLISSGLNWINPSITDIKQAIRIFHECKINGLYDCLNKPFLIDGTIDIDHESMREYHTNYLKDKTKNIIYK